MREHVRRFFIVPDLLAAPGAINFRVIGDEYYAIVPEGTDPVSSELRRAYLQYVIDPLMLRFNQAIAGRRDQIKQIISEREKAGATVTPDVFIVVSRSLVAAADARFEESKRLEALAREAARQAGPDQGRGDARHDSPGNSRGDERNSGRRRGQARRRL